MVGALWEFLKQEVWSIDYFLFLSYDITCAEVGLLPLYSEFKEEENKLYVVLEAGSEDLASFFRSQTQNRKPLSDSVTWFYWERMLLAVQALHKEGMFDAFQPAVSVSLTVILG